MRNVWTILIGTTAAVAVISATTASSTRAEVALTDPQIAHIAYTAGAIDVDAAKQALAKTHNATIRAFAEQMQRDHEAVNAQALELCKALNVTPEDNPTSQTLSKAAADTRARLAGLSGAAFDRAYIDNEVAFHKTVNDALKDTLIPSASNARLKALLETGLKLFLGHQQHAEHTAAAIKSSARDSSARQAPAVTHVTIKDMAFSPASVAVHPGDTILWTNLDVVDHTATADGGAFDVAIAAGRSGRVSIDRAGTIGYHCRLHPNMTGTVTAKAA
jgi:putative membrane protein